MMRSRPIGAGIGLGRRKTDVEDRALLLQRRIGEPDVAVRDAGRPGCRMRKSRRSNSTEAEVSTTSATVLKPIQRPDQRDIAQPCRPSSSRSRTSAGTSTGIAAGDQRRLALVRHGGGFAAMVVAGHQQHAAIARGAGVVGVPEHVAAAVDARTLAVPEGEHAVVFGVAQQRHLLGAPDGGGGEFLVHPRPETMCCASRCVRACHIWMSTWPSGEPR